MVDRHDYARRKGIVDQAVGSFDKKRNDALAAEAEQFVAEYLGVEWHEKRVDGGVDLNFRGWTIDVKWSPLVPFRPGTKTRFFYACLRVPAWKPRRAMIYAAVMGSVRPFSNPDGTGIGPLDDDAMKLYGWAFKREVDQAPVRDWGYTNYRDEPALVHAVDLTDLHSRELLKALPPFDPERTMNETLALAFEAVEPGWRY